MYVHPDVNVASGFIYGSCRYRALLAQRKVWCKACHICLLFGNCHLVQSMHLCNERTSKVVIRATHPRNRCTMVCATYFLLGLDSESTRFSQLCGGIPHATVHCFGQDWCWVRNVRMFDLRTCVTRRLCVNHLKYPFAGRLCLCLMAWGLLRTLVKFFVLPFTWAVWPEEIH